jgi:hypothetical protein
MIICPTPQLALAAMHEKHDFFMQEKFREYTGGDQVQLLPENAPPAPQDGARKAEQIQKMQKASTTRMKLKMRDETKNEKSDRFLTSR